VSSQEFAKLQEYLNELVKQFNQKLNFNEPVEMTKFQQPVLQPPSSWPAPTIRVYDQSPRVWVSVSFGPPVRTALLEAVAKDFVAPSDSSVGQYESELNVGRTFAPDVDSSTVRDWVLHTREFLSNSFEDINRVITQHNNRIQQMVSDMNTSVTRVAELEGELSDL
jgi:uncharacterized FlaG/YvyC family protein